MFLTSGDLYPFLEKIIMKFPHIINEKAEVELKNDEEALTVLDLVRYANVHTQKPLMEQELRFVAAYPRIARKVMTVML